MVLPIHDENPTRRTPVVTYLLIALNIAIFLVEPVSGLHGRPGEPPIVATCRQQAFFQQYAAIPKELVSGRQLPTAVGPAAIDQRTGQVGCLAVRPAYDKAPPLSALFAMFLHGGWIHLLGNMLFLWVFGNNVEDRFGRVRYLVFYLAVGLLATYAFALLAPSSTQPLVGASGAIAGVLGAYLVLFPKARVTSLLPFLFFLPLRLPAWLVLGSWFLLQYFYAAGAGVNAATGVAYVAHVAGFLLGVFYVLIGVPRRPRAVA